MAQRRPVSWAPGDDDTDPELTPPAHSGFSFSRSASHHAAALIAALPSRQISMDLEGTIQRSGSERLSLKLRRRRTMKHQRSSDYVDGDVEMQPLNTNERPMTLSADEADMWEKTQSLRGMTASLSTKRKFRACSTKTAAEANKFEMDRKGGKTTGGKSDVEDEWLQMAMQQAAIYPGGGIDNGSDESDEVEEEEEGDDDEEFSDDDDEDADEFSIAQRETMQLKGMHRRRLRRKSLKANFQKDPDNKLGGKAIVKEKRKFLFVPIPAGGKNDLSDVTRQISHVEGVEIKNAATSDNNGPKGPSVLSPKKDSPNRTDVHITSGISKQKPQIANDKVSGVSLALEKEGNPISGGVHRSLSLEGKQNPSNTGLSIGEEARKDTSILTLDKPNPSATAKATVSSVIENQASKNMSKDSNVPKASMANGNTFGSTVNVPRNETTLSNSSHVASSESIMNDDVNVSVDLSGSVDKLKISSEESKEQKLYSEESGNNSSNKNSTIEIETERRTVKSLNQVNGKSESVNSNHDKSSVYDTNVTSKHERDEHVEAVRDKTHVTRNKNSSLRRQNSRNFAELSKLSGRSKIKNQVSIQRSLNQPITSLNTDSDHEANSAADNQDNSAAVTVQVKDQLTENSRGDGAVEKCVQSEPNSNLVTTAESVPRPSESALSCQKVFGPFTIQQDVNASNETCGELTNVISTHNKTEKPPSEPSAIENESVKLQNLDEKGDRDKPKEKPVLNDKLTGRTDSTSNKVKVISSTKKGTTNTNDLKDDVSRRGLEKSQDKKEEARQLKSVARDMNTGEVGVSLKGSRNTPILDTIRNTPQSQSEQEPTPVKKPKVTSTLKKTTGAQDAEKDVKVIDEENKAMLKTKEKSPKVSEVKRSGAGRERATLPIFVGKKKGQKGVANVMSAVKDQKSVDAEKNSPPSKEDKSGQKREINVNTKDSGLSNAREDGKKLDAKKQASSLKAKEKKTAPVDVAKSDDGRDKTTVKKDAQSVAVHGNVEIRTSETEKKALEEKAKAEAPKQTASEDEISPKGKGVKVYGASRIATYAKKATPSSENKKRTSAKEAKSVSGEIESPEGSGEKNSAVAEVEADTSDYEKKNGKEQLPTLGKDKETACTANSTVVRNTNQKVSEKAAVPIEEAKATVDGNKIGALSVSDQEKADMIENASCLQVAEMKSDEKNLKQTPPEKDTEVQVPKYNTYSAKEKMKKGLTSSNANNDYESKKLVASLVTEEEKIVKNNEANVKAENVKPAGCGNLNTDKADPKSLNEARKPEGMHRSPETKAPVTSSSKNELELQVPFSGTGSVPTSPTIIPQRRPLMIVKMKSLLPLPSDSREYLCDPPLVPASGDPYDSPSRIIREKGKSHFWKDDDLSSLTSLSSENEKPYLFPVLSRAVRTQPFSFYSNCDNISSERDSPYVESADAIISMPSQGDEKHISPVSPAADSWKNSGSEVDASSVSNCEDDYFGMAALLATKKYQPFTSQNNYDILEQVYGVQGSSTSTVLDDQSLFDRGSDIVDFASLTQLASQTTSPLHIDSAIQSGSVNIEEDRKLVSAGDESELKQVPIPLELNESEKESKWKQVPIPLELKETEKESKWKQVPIPLVLNESEKESKWKQVSIPLELKETEKESKWKQVPIPLELKENENETKWKQVPIPLELKENEKETKWKQVPIPLELKDTEKESKWKQVPIPLEIDEEKGTGMVTDARSVSSSSMTPVEQPEEGLSMIEMLRNQSHVTKVVRRTSGMDRSGSESRTIAKVSQKSPSANVTVGDSSEKSEEGSTSLIDLLRRQSKITERLRLASSVERNSDLPDVPVEENVSLIDMLRNKSQLDQAAARRNGTVGLGERGSRLDKLRQQSQLSESVRRSENCDAKDISGRGTEVTETLQKQPISEKGKGSGCNVSTASGQPGFPSASQRKINVRPVRSPVPESSESNDLNGQVSEEILETQSLPGENDQPPSVSSKPGNLRSKSVTPSGMAAAKWQGSVSKKKNSVSQSSSNMGKGQSPPHSDGKLKNGAARSTLTRQQSSLSSSSKSSSKSLSRHQSLATEKTRPSFAQKAKSVMSSSSSSPSNVKKGVSANSQKENWKTVRNNQQNLVKDSAEVSNQKLESVESVGFVSSPKVIEKVGRVDEDTAVEKPDSTPERSPETGEVQRKPVVKEVVQKDVHKDTEKVIPTDTIIDITDDEDDLHQVVVDDGKKLVKAPSLSGSHDGQIITTMTVTTVRQRPCNLSQLMDSTAELRQAKALVTARHRALFQKTPPFLARKKILYETPDGFEQSRLMNEPIKKLKGFQKWKHTRRVEWRRFKDRVSDAFSSLIIWNGSFKQIEGAFGMGIGSYYRFLKFLFLLNIVIALIMILPITVPQAIFSPATFNESLQLLNFSTAAAGVPIISAQVAAPTPSINDTVGVAQALTSSVTSLDFVADALTCSANYTAIVDQRVSVASPLESVLSFLQGDGWMTNTILFAGYYFNKTVYNYEDDSPGAPVYSYNMPLAYILATGAYFLISLIVMVKYIGEGFRQNFLEGEGKIFAYCNNTFGGWDYCISTEKAAKMKQKILYADLTRDLENERMKIRRSNRTTKQKCSLYFKRLLINIVVITILCGSGYLIFLSNKYSLEWGQLTDLNDFVKLIVEYLPALVISILNFIIPLMFIHIVRPEDYTPEFEIRITLLRTVFLRLASLAVLILSVYTQITNCTTYVCGNCQATSYCWETFIGQQFYKLVMLDFFIPVGIAIFVEFPRNLLYKKFSHWKLFKLIGEQEFIIAKQVLDIVYSQTLCWIGAFFCPIIPGMTVVKFFILFYIKKYVLLICCVPSARTYRASNSNAFFTSMLLLSFILTCLPVGWSIAKIPPSQSCGAFRLYSKSDFVMFDSITNVIGTWPKEVKEAFYFLGSPAFYAPLAVLLLILIYYYYCVASGHQRMIELLKGELAMEGKDKKFLLDRVYEAQMKKESLARQTAAS